MVLLNRVSSSTKRSPRAAEQTLVLPSIRLAFVGRVRRAFRQVGPASCDAGPPSEPDVPVSRHPARAGLGGWRVWLQWRWMRRGAALSGWVVSQTTSIVLPVVASQCSHSRGVWGRSWSASRVLLEIAQRPSWPR